MPALRPEGERPLSDYFGKVGDAMHAPEFAHYVPIGGRATETCHEVATAIPPPLTSNEHQSSPRGYRDGIRMPDDLKSSNRAHWFMVIAISDRSVPRRLRSSRSSICDITGILTFFKSQCQHFSIVLR